MTDTALAEARSSFDRIMVDPAPADLWALQQALLVIGTEPAALARAVARAFHACLRNLESKSASRSASRWGAVLGTAAVGSVSVGEMGNSREAALQGLVHGARSGRARGRAPPSSRPRRGRSRPGCSTTTWRGSCTTSCGTSSLAARPDLPPAERRDQVALVLDPLLDVTVPDGDRAALAVNVFTTVLAARLVPLFGEPSTGVAAEG